jgi:poly(A) polymerase
MTDATPPLRLEASWLAELARARVFAALAARGHVARAVGGAVRNTLLGMPVADVDVATTATPQETIAAARAAGLRALPTGIAHGTVTLVVDGVTTEVTTLRTDVETHGRHATVAFTTDWLADAERRDFTMNALYCDADGTLFDPLGGYADLMARRVRFIGDARTRIREDYLRILRFFRFTAQYGAGPLDAGGLAACIGERDGLARLSAERIAQEVQRLLVAPRGIDIVGEMFAHGLLASLLGRAPDVTRLTRLGACEAALGVAPDFARRLAALAVQVDEDATFLQTRLRLSNATTTRLRAAAGAPRGNAPPEPAAARALCYRLGAEHYRDAILAAWSRRTGETQTTAWRALYALPDTWQPPRLPLDGNDAATAGIAAGPEMGAALRRAEEAWIASDFTLPRDALRALLKA